MTSLRVALALVVAGVAISLVAVSGVLGPTQRPPSQPISEREQVREVYTFDDLAPMVAASDAVAVATVSGSSLGRLLGSESDTGGVQFTEVLIHVDAVLFGSLSEGSLTLEIDDSLIPEEDRWDVPGKELLVFLHQKLDRPEVYRPTNSQGVFVLDGDRVAPAIAQDLFTKSLAGMSRKDLIRQVEAAASAVREGSVTPPPVR